MKVAFLTEHFAPKIDGVATRLSHSLFYLSKNQISTIVLTASQNFNQIYNVNENGTPIYRMPAIAFPFYPEKRLVIPTKKIETILLSFKPDIIHVVNPTLFGYCGIKIAKKYKIPIIVSQHSNYAIYLEYFNLAIFKKLVWKWIKKTLNDADMVLCTSNQMLDTLKLHGVANLSVWQPGVATDQIMPMLKNNKIRAQLGATDPYAFLLIYAGRLSPEKNIELIKPALLKNPNLRLALIGDGPHKIKLIKHFTGTKTIFLPFQKGHILHTIYASADALILPSCTETLGLVLLEAMAAGTVAIGANAGGIPSLIKHNHNGFLFKPNSSEAIADIISMISKLEANTLSSIKKSARQTAEEWSWENTTKQLIQFYNKMITSYRKIWT